MMLEPVNNVGSINKQSIQTSGKETKSNVDIGMDETTRTVEVSDTVRVEESMASNSVQTDRQQSQEQIKKALEKIHKSLPNSEAVFSIHDGTNRVTIKIIDKDTKEVIKEYPPEKTLDMISKVWELAGMMVDEKR